MPSAEFRFYEELNDLLPAVRKKVSFTCSFAGTPSVKDAIESCGVPHTEIDLILVDGESVGFGHNLCGGERVAVYPVFEGMDITPVTRLRAQPLRELTFLVDANVRRLVRILRLLGFDTLDDDGMEDSELAATAAELGLTILTRDRGLLMRKVVTRAYFVRSQDPVIQAAEVIRRFDLHDQVKSFSRCVHCNGIIKPIPKARIEHLLPPKTRIHYNDFFQCPRCERLYWQGAHWDNLQGLIGRIREAAGEPQSW